MHISILLCGGNNSTQESQESNDGRPKQEPSLYSLKRDYEIKVYLIPMIAHLACF